NIENVSDDKYKNLFNSISSVLDDMLNVIEDMSNRQDYLEENVQYIDEDLTGLQDELFQEVSIEDLIEMDDEYIEISCKNCEKPLFVEKESIDNNKVIPCPFCNRDAI
ncbi:CD1247 N-terminal domain-containing protein, partial [Clostridium perfringens]